MSTTRTSCQGTHFSWTFRQNISFLSKSINFKRIGLKYDGWYLIYSKKKIGWSLKFVFIYFHNFWNFFIFFLQDGQCQADVVMKRFIDFIKSKDQHRFRRTVGILGELNTSEPNLSSIYKKQCQNVLYSTASNWGWYDGRWKNVTDGQIDLVSN